MTLNLAEYEDRPLRNPPVRRVICQVRFTPLLGVAQKLPADFHNQIRARYPGFNVRQHVGIDVGQPLPSEYEFSSPSGFSTASLGISFVALATSEYSDWKSFKAEMQSVLEAFSSSYETVHASRLGLRYVNELLPGTTGTKSAQELVGILNKDLRCLLTNDAWSIPRKAVYQLSLPDEDNELTITLTFDQEVEPRVGLDFDYFSVFDPPIRMNVNDIVRRLDECHHKKAYYAFRWSLDEGRVDVFDPSE